MRSMTLRGTLHSLPDECHSKEDGDLLSPPTLTDALEEEELAAFLAPVEIRKPAAATAAAQAAVATARTETEAIRCCSQFVGRSSPSAAPHPNQ